MDSPWDHLAFSNEPPWVKRSHEIDEEVERIVHGAQNRLKSDSSEYAFIRDFLTIYLLNDLVVKLEGLGRPTTHVVVDPKTYGEMRQWDCIEEQPDINERAAGWYATIWTMKVYVRVQCGDCIYIGSLIDGIDDVGMKIQIQR